MPEPALSQKDIRQFHNGVIREVDNPLMPESAVDLAINCHFDRIPLVTRRLGLTILGNQIGGTENTPTHSPSLDGYVLRGG